MNWVDPTDITAEHVLGVFAALVVGALLAVLGLAVIYWVAG